MNNTPLRRIVACGWAAALLATTVAHANTEPAQPEPPAPEQVESDSQARWERALPRVEKWVRGLLDRSEPIKATVEVLDGESFSERAVGSAHAAHAAEGGLPPILIAATTKDAEILICAPVFELLVERAGTDGFLPDDLISLVLAHELAHAAHLDTLATIEVGENIDKALAERLAATMIMREAHAVFVQHTVASRLGGEPFEQMSRDLIASTPLASEYAKIVVVGEQLLRRAHDSGGAEAVRAILLDPPADAVQILTLGSPKIALADALTERLKDAAGHGEWVMVTREGVGATLGQGWHWITAEEREEIESSIDRAFLLLLVDSTSRTRRAISLGVLEFKNETEAKQGPDRLKDVLELIASRFEYTPDGGRRDATLVEWPGVYGWRAIAAHHPMADEPASFGAMAVTRRGRTMLILNGIGMPDHKDQLAGMLRSIDKAF